MNIIDSNFVTQVVMEVRRRRLEKTCRVVKAFVKSSGGWSKAFPDKSADYPKFDLLSKEGSWCLEEMRMLSGDIAILREHLGIPMDFRTTNRDTESGVIALCMLLYRLARTRRYSDLRETFGCSGHRVGRISNTLAVYLYNKFKHKLDALDRERFPVQVLLFVIDLTLDLD
jgi:hypothetical protein